MNIFKKPLIIVLFNLTAFFFGTFISSYSQTYIYVPCGQDDNYSGPAGEESEIIFYNQTDQLLKYYWIDEEGFVELYGEIPEGESVSVNTFINHFWLITDIEDSCVGIFIPMVPGSVEINLYLDPDLLTQEALLNEQNIEDALKAELAYASGEENDEENYSEANQTKRKKIPNEIIELPKDVKKLDLDDKFFTGEWNSLHSSLKSSEQLVYYAAHPQIMGQKINDKLFISWNDASTKKINIACLSSQGGKLTLEWKKSLPGGLDKLAGFTTDKKYLYIMSAIDEDLSNDVKIKGFRNGVLNLTKMDLNGNSIWIRDLNSNQILEKPFFSPMVAGTATMAFGNNKLAVICSTLGIPDNEGFRHQGAKYFILNPETGQNDYDQVGGTSWRHSFDQRILFDGRDFVILDLADAGWYLPAGGIAVRKITFYDGELQMPPQAEGIFVYARQAETAGNQNFAFISMGDIVSGTKGYSVLFTSEKTNQNATRRGWSEPVLEPRNVGFVHVVKNFETVLDGNTTNGSEKVASEGNTYLNYDKGSIDMINITDNIVDIRKYNSSAQPGGNTYQRVDKPNLKFREGAVLWLTNYKKAEKFISAERPKLYKISNENYLALWEEWEVKPGSGKPTMTYLKTIALVVDEFGNKLSDQVTINARLNPGGAEQLFNIDGKVAWITGNGNEWLLHTLDSSLNLTTVKIEL